MTYYNRQGDNYFLATETSFDLSKILPAGVYEIKSSMMGFYLERGKSFELPPKFYGKLLKHADRILTTFDQRTSNTGILLSGEKGSGKTLLAKYLAVHCEQEKKMPILLLNEPFYGPEFNKFLQSIDQPCVVLIDEFEKIYNNRANSDKQLKNVDTDESPASQDALLTLLDGVYPSKKMFILTSNLTSKVNQYMLGRPGRLYYHITYGHLEEDFIREYCEDLLNNKSWVENIVQISTMHGKFNFDMLQALINETNRFNEPPEEVAEILNIHPEGRNTNAEYDITDILDGRGNSIFNPVYKKRVLQYASVRQQLNQKKFHVTSDTRYFPLGSVREDLFEMFRERAGYTNEFTYLEAINDIQTRTNSYNFDLDYYINGIERVSPDGTVVIKCDENIGEFYILGRRAKDVSFSYGNYVSAFKDL